MKPITGKIEVQYNTRKKFVRVFRISPSRMTRVSRKFLTYLLGEEIGKAQYDIVEDIELYRKSRHK